MVSPGQLLIHWYSRPVAAGFLIYLRNVHCKSERVSRPFNGPLPPLRGPGPSKPGKYTPDSNDRNSNSYAHKYLKLVKGTGNPCTSLPGSPGFSGYYFFEPAAPTMTPIDWVKSGSISPGIPITISLSAIPENFLEPSQPSEKLGLPVR